MADSGRCKSCGRPILWVRTAGGKAMPLDALPDPERGNVRLVDGGRAEVIASAELIALRADGATLYTSHFATCPDAGRFRRAG